MKHWIKLGEAPIPGSDGHLELFQGKDDFFIRTSSGIELMFCIKKKNPLRIMLDGVFIPNTT